MARDADAWLASIQKVSMSSDKIIAAVMAGAASALIQSPTQLVEVNQSNHGSSMIATARKVIAQNGVLGLYRGYSMGATREGIFCSSYIAINPSIKKWMKEKRPELSDGAATVVASVASGSLGAALSHPADTLKTRLQAGALPLRAGEAAEATRIRGPWQALQDLRLKGNLWSQCYAGFSPRLFRLVCCTYIYSTLTDACEAFCRSNAGLTLRGQLQLSVEPLS
ncbi:ODC1 [Symbiodinium natans]|uniref:ODC1 protein n=1 Tax=Symbiodinium natans TaxID=878477 RepID=A0A812Q8C3_9DINO|nr:ODC1 [Symbiodinium natans]